MCKKWTPYYIVKNVKTLNVWQLEMLSLRLQINKNKPMSIKQNIPNVITLGNVICGCLAINSLFTEEYMMVFWLMFIAGWLDLGDGLTARLLNVKSELGKELDSLADMVTFGALPGFIMFHLISESLDGQPEYLAYIGFIVAAASAFRLAKFNLDTRQTTNFIGVPTPANASFTVGLLLIWHFDELGLKDLLTTPVLIILTLLMSYLLNSNFMMFSFKMKDFKWQGNEFRYLYLIICFGLMPFIGWSIFGIGFFIYVIISLLFRNKIV